MGWIIALVVAIVAIVALVVTLILVIGLRSGDEKTSAVREATPVPSPSQTQEPTEEKTKKKQKDKPPAAAGGLRDVREEPAGLFCRDLSSKGYSYVAAVDYWRVHGQPNQMDADRNGIPCETIFPLSDVEAYWGPQDYVPDDYVGIETLPSGLMCRDLYNGGYSYPQAVDYWWYWGAPDRMDADLNGFPCETIYPSGSITDFWYG